jgi:hypothetical protein
MHFTASWWVEICDLMRVDINCSATLCAHIPLIRVEFHRQKKGHYQLLHMAASGCLRKLFDCMCRVATVVWNDVWDDELLCGGSSVLMR